MQEYKNWCWSKSWRCHNNRFILVILYPGNPQFLISFLKPTRVNFHNTIVYHEYFITLKNVNIFNKMMVMALGEILLIAKGGIARLFHKMKWKYVLRYSICFGRLIQSQKYRVMLAYLCYISFCDTTERCRICYYHFYTDEILRFL